MTINVAINGFGRIGRNVLRAIVEGGRNDIRVVAINDLGPVETNAHLLQFDSVHGRFPAEVKTTDDTIDVGRGPMKVTALRDPAELPWSDVDVVLECTGIFTSKEACQAHLENGSSRVLISAPGKDADKTIVYGVNHDTLTAEDLIVSNASCTTNCSVPLLKLLNEAVGLEYVSITTIHSAMNDQPVIDAYHQTDLRLTRSAMQSIVPVDTGLAVGISRLMPSLAGRFECLHVRVPTINVSAMDAALTVRRDTSAAQVNALLHNASQQRLQGVLGYTEAPMASIDFNHDPRSGILDATQTRVAGTRLIKLLCWFDNEWGFANRMLDISQRLATFR